MSHKDSHHLAYIRSLSLLFFGNSSHVLSHIRSLSLLPLRTLSVLPSSIISLMSQSFILLSSSRPSLQSCHEVLGRTGFRGVGQTIKFKYGDGAEHADEASAVAAGKAWLAAERVRQSS